MLSLSISPSLLTLIINMFPIQHNKGLGSNQYQNRLLSLFPTYQPSSLTSSSSINDLGDQDEDHHHQPQEANVTVDFVRSGEDHFTNKIDQESDDDSETRSVKWIRSPKTRLTNKTKNSNQQININVITRVCSDCNTTKTPLWRSGPQGPKTLCNACGIRQRKARQAMAGGAKASSTHHGLVHSDRGNISAVVPYKKRCKFFPAKDRKPIDLINDDLDSDDHLHGVFPQDEKEAALLLMALSCGLVCGSSPSCVL